MKVITILGTRPELIRLSLTINLLDSFVKHIIVHTGQNYDFELNEIFYKELNIRKPDYYLNIEYNTPFDFIGNLLIKIEKILIDEKPNAIVILGDTNSSLSAVVAKRLKIPIFHIEAGNRSFDPNVPEEINRKLVDVISDFNLVYSERSRQHLLSEGFEARRIYNIGSPITELWNTHKTNIETLSTYKSLKLDKEEYLLASFHREENVDSKEILSELVSSLEVVSKTLNKTIVISTHPRTKLRLEKFGIGYTENLRFLKPFGFYEYMNLQINSYCVISDSGTISEESSICNFKAITVRQSMERPEAIDEAAISMSGFNSESILSAIKLQTIKKRVVPVDYQKHNSSEIILNVILSFANLSNRWAGIRYTDYS